MITRENKIKFLVSSGLLLCFIAVIQPWNLYFLNDDFVHIPLSTKSIWVHFEFFRPVPNILTSLEVRLFGSHPLGFHIVSIVLHIIATFCVYKLCNQLIYHYHPGLQYNQAGFIAGCLFFIYPFHSEPVMWIIGRIGILASIFIIASLILFLNRSRRSYYHYLSLLFFAVALLTYEISWIVPVFITLLSITDQDGFKKSFKRDFLHSLPYWLIFGIVLFIRSVVLQQLVTEYELSSRDVSLVSLTGNFFRLLARTLVPPAKATTDFIILFVLAVAVLSVFLFFLFKSRRVRFLHILLLTLLSISYIPTISLGIDTHGSEGERYLYLPSVFWISFLAILLCELPPRTGRYITCSICFIYFILLTNAASHYQHASAVAKKLLSFIGNYSQSGKIIALNIPSNYKGALIFRSGFTEAVQWMHPQLRADTVIVSTAERTFHEIASLDSTTKQNFDAFSEIKLQVVDGDNQRLFFKKEKISYNVREDLLIFFDSNSKAGLVIYPTAY